MERFGLHLLTLAEQLRMSLDELETDEGDPDRLQKLYRVDHAVTRMRRASRDLRTLAGRGEEELSGTDTPLLDVIRVALSAIERYTQVTIGRVADFGVLGYAADDVASLLAALLDNATRYSPGITSISAHLTEGGSVLFRISDNGIGMDPDGVAALNAMLAGDVPGPDDRTARHTGFPVVHRIARKHSIGVRLAARPTPGSGTIALVTVPPELMCELPDEAPRPAAASPVGGPEARASDASASETSAFGGNASGASASGAEASVSVLRTARRVPAAPSTPPSGMTYQQAADTAEGDGSVEPAGPVSTADTADGAAGGRTRSGLPRRERASLRGTKARSGGRPGPRSGPGPDGDSGSADGFRQEGESGPTGDFGGAGSSESANGFGQAGSSGPASGFGQAGGFGGGQPPVPSAEQLAAARHSFADDLAAFSLGSSGAPSPQTQATPEGRTVPESAVPGTQAPETTIHGQRAIPEAAVPESAEPETDMPEKQDPGQGASS